MLSLIILFYFLNLPICTYRQEAYHFFDDFYYNEILSTYDKQLSNEKKKNICSMIDGPNCFFISKNIYEPSISNFSELRAYYNNSIKKYSTDRKKVKLLTSNLLYKLYLTFESYNLKVLNSEKDFFFPSELLISSKNSYYFKVYTKGKLLIQNKEENFYRNEDAISQKFKPRDAYGITLDEVEFSLGNKFYFRYVYVRCHNFNNKYSIKGIDDDKEVIFEFKDTVECNNKWKKVSFNEYMEISYLIISPNIEIDNILFEKNMDDINNESLNQYNKKKKLIEIKTKIITKNLEYIIKIEIEKKKKNQE